MMQRIASLTSGLTACATTLRRGLEPTEISVSGLCNHQYYLLPEGAYPHKQ
jgi:hypothetical protein